MIIIGIDPGLSGGIAMFDTKHDAMRSDPMPVLSIVRHGKQKREVDPHRLVLMLQTVRANHCYIEQQAARPGQGVTSMFSLGRSFGICLGILAAMEIPVTRVTANEWKRALGVPASKDAARQRASELMPQSAHFWRLAKQDGLAEAALIALYGAREMGQ